MLKNIVNHGIYGKVPLYDVREVSTFREMFESSVALYENNKDINELLEVIIERPNLNTKDFLYGFATHILESRK